MPDISGNAAVMGQANKSQVSGAMTIQTYANSALEQPKVDFSGISDLLPYQKQINDGLAIAQNHAQYYLNTLQDKIIVNMANISNYYQLNKVLPETLPTGSTEDQWVKTLNAVRQQSQSYYSAAKQLVTDLRDFSNQLATDSQAFSITISELNSKVGGNEGVLQNINKELDKIQSAIDGYIAGITISGLTVAAGVFTICVGAIEDFITAGTTTPLIFGGVGIVLGGVSGEAASIKGLIDGNNSKAQLLSQEKNLSAEVKLAASVSRGYSSLSNQVKNAITTATAMANAWANVDSDLDEIITDLSQGITNTDLIRTMFVTAANNEITTLLQDIQTVKQQMSGVNVRNASSGQTVSQLIASVAGQ
ncbi:HBL/NHE enterotoxin family protein [Yokenella regensburgei]|uniref:HBL/NHE enterotoxin family protein n=1 Tax=Yokenella regensburgei TaxID=158877 RepID=UPI001375E333|nr:HBL/NHE enterotoxin family protein [Yokenella regensburgei]KAF1366504.1 hypothetical protein FHR25_005023 [Yokenella regensburgei]